VIALVLGLSASVVWGLADFLGGLQSRRVGLMGVVLVSQLAGFAGIVVVVGLAAGAPPAASALAPAALSGLVGAGALAAFYRALAVGTMTVIAPTVATLGAVVPVLFGVAAGERPSLVQVAGMALAAVGILLATRAVGGAPVEASEGKSAGVPLAVLAGVLLGFVLLGLDAAARADPLWAVLASRVFSLTAVALVAVPLRRSVEVDRRALPLLILIGLCDTGANVFFALATTLGLLSVVTVLASLYPVVTVLLARAVLGERVGGWQRAGVVAALAGVLAIAAG
jgi:drug/metabolite transporter (DMT)-like permease